MQMRVPALLALSIGIIGGLAGCPEQTGQVGGGGTGPTVPPNITVPAEFQEGEKLFDGNCRRCHGPRAGGTDQGPPLLHELYVPSHHGDSSFQLAVRNGVQSHHWSFGNMPPIAGLTIEDVNEVISYVRFLQRQAGVE